MPDPAPATTAPVSAIVLGAGSNERFSGHHSKLLAEWRGLTLLEHVLDAATNARLAGVVSEVVMVTRDDEARIKSLAVGAGCRVVHPPAGQPIAASLRTAIAAVDPSAEGVVVLLADQPLVTHLAIRAVVEAAGRSPQALVRAHYRGTADPISHPVFIGRYHFGLIHQIEGDATFQATTERLGLRWSEIWLDGDNPDIDHVFDLSRLR